MDVRKSDGRLEEYSSDKVKSGIFAAYNKAKQVYDENVGNEICDGLKIYDGITTEEIRGQVEDTLMSINKKAAKAYVKYGDEESFIKDRSRYMEEYISSSDNASTSSETDPNANVTMKNVANLDSEVYKTNNRRQQRYGMKQILKKLYPEYANRYAEDLENHIIYAHDEASSPARKNYCEAVTLYPLLLEGTKTMDGLNTTPPKNLSAFCGQLVNLTFLLASQCKGAVAFGEFFNFFDYFCVKDFGENYHKEVDQFVHIGPKLRKLLNVTGKWVPTLSELEKTDFGEYNYLKEEIVKDAMRAATKEELAEWLEEAKKNPIAELSLGDGTKTIKGAIHQAFQQIVYGWNQPASNRGFQSPFENISYYDSNYYKALFEDFSFPDGTKPSWERVSFLQKDFALWFCAERSKTLLTFPVETMALLTDGKDVIDKEYKDFTAELWAKGHSFFLYLSDTPDSLASCCRLSNKIERNVFSFTNGLTGVQTGSCNVITLNLNRIIQLYFRSIGDNDAFPKKRAYRTPEFEQYLRDIVSRVMKYQIAYKTLLYDVEKKGMLTASKAGYITMNKLFSTIGVNGFNESAEFIGLKCSYNDDYKDYCRFITGIISDEESKETDPRFKMNLEYVPAESLGGKNYNWDKKDGFWVPEDRVLYNSYFYLADDPDTTVLDKLKMHGKEFTEKLSGGVGCHINLDEHLSKEQYLLLMDYAIKYGTSYYTFNVLNCSCDECNHIEKRHFDVCPKCGSKKTTDWTRIIGYLRPVSAFEKLRRLEAKKRVYSKSIE